MLGCTRLFYRRQSARHDGFVSKRSAMGRPAVGALCVVATAGVIVGMDVLFFRSHFWERLAANVGVVLIFGSAAWSG